MKSELKLEHLAPYLPYGLKVKDNERIYTMDTNNNNSDGIETVLYGINQLPILRPLSDLTKEIEHNGERFVPKNMFNTKFEYLFTNIEYYNVQNDLSYSVVRKLIEWHFDVFGLIDKELAIDINNLNNQK